MIRVGVSEAKNRLSHFIRLVRGREEVEIMDRQTPVLRIVHVPKFEIRRSRFPALSNGTGCTNTESKCSNARNRQMGETY